MKEFFCITVCFIVNKVAAFHIYLNELMHADQECIWRRRIGQLARIFIFEPTKQHLYKELRKNI